MANIEELAALLFGGSKEEESTASAAAFIYGTAVTDSADGYVTVAIGDDIYAADDEDEAGYELLTLTEDADSVDAIDDDELYDEEEGEETVSWDGGDDDDAGEESDE